MPLPPEVLEIIRQEEQTLAEVMSSLKAQIASGAHRYYNEAARARELTGKIVAARRDDDKQQLISDEAVSHQLTKAKRAEIKTLDKLLDRPYFARIVLLEERNGSPYEIEYKLGLAANPDCRIIDWRKAPIAKLYYEYREGDEYSELILGNEREGTIKLRHKLDIENGELRGVHCSYGSFIKTNGEWKSTVAAGASSRPARSYRQLPDVLSLITAEQFRLITEDSTSAVLIQGIAGSGKTTVALYRLAWLLHERQHELSAENTAVLVLSRVLRNYIAASLSPLNIEEVPVLQFDDWVSSRLRLHAADAGDAAVLEMLAHPRLNSAPGVNRLKRSPALAAALADWVPSGEGASAAASGSALDGLMALMTSPQRIIDADEFKLVDRQLVRDAVDHTRSCWERGQLDYNDCSLLLRIYQLRRRGTVRKLGHIVADEVQDLSAVELDAIIGEVADSSQLTLVGDMNQQLNSSVSGFPGWERLQKHRALDDKGLIFSKLTVSHRSSLPIMRFADHVLGAQRTTEGRKGKAPLWFRCLSENEGVRQAIGWMNRVLERFPSSLVAVICRSSQEARIVHSMLEPTFGSAVTLGEEANFSFNEGILVCGVREVKGLEFPQVLIWNPDSRSYPASQSSRNRLYVAITRAQDHLCLVTWGEPSPLLPHIHSALVRGYEPDRPEDE